jgi:hypothetical protein
MDRCFGTIQQTASLFGTKNEIGSYYYVDDAVRT